MINVIYHKRMQMVKINVKLNKSPITMKTRQ